MVRTYSFLSLGEKCPYSELFWSAFFHIRTEYGETRSIFPYSVQMRENTDQNNSEYGHFSRSACDKCKNDLHSRSITGSITTIAGLH